MIYETFLWIVQKEIKLVKKEKKKFFDKSIEIFFIGRTESCN